MALKAKAIWNTIKAAGSGWANDKATRLGAALSYYTVFAIPPLLIIVLFIASLVFNPEQVRSAMFSEVGGLIGKKSADAIQSAMSAQYQSNKGTVASILAIVALIATATGLFLELQDDLNLIWGVEEKPGQGIWGFIKNRLLSFAMIVGIGFLLLVSLVVSAGLAAFSKYMSMLTPGLGILTEIANDAVGFLVIAALFAMIYKVLPDVKIAWRDVWVGAAVTSLLFVAGKFAIGWYLGRSSTVSAYGAAGSIILVLLWVYYSAQILFFGAEITKVYANRFGRHLEPSAHAQWIVPPQTAMDPKSKHSPARKPVTAARHSNKKTSSKKDDHETRHAELMSELRREVEALRDVVER